VGVIASRINRVQRIMQKLGITLEEAEYYVDKYDTERISLIKTVFDRDPTDLMLYNLLINTDHYTIENAADIIVHAIGKMEKRTDGNQLVEALKNKAFAKRIEALVRRKLTSAVAGNVEICADSEGVIRISGRIREKADKAKVEKIAAEYPGVREVVNELKVTDLTFRI
jgi:hypothetical protein